MKNNKSFSNKPKQISQRRTLRKNQTKSEYIIWQKLRSSQLGVKFRRQYGIGKFIVDFYCHKLKLIIEIDGHIHAEQKNYDKYRQEYLEKLGFTVIRYRNEQILYELENVLEDIKSKIN